MELTGAKRMTTTRKSDGSYNHDVTISPKLLDVLQLLEGGEKFRECILRY